MDRVIQSTWPCGCVACICASEERCYGCGAKCCDKGSECERVVRMEELARLTAERDAAIARAERAERDKNELLEVRQSLHAAMMLEWRGVEHGCECLACGGAGVKSYPSTSTWRGGFGGQMFTTDVCDACWGSGDRSRAWPSHRALADGALREAELMARAERAEFFIANQGYRRCDIPACNCPYWHGGNASTRLREISDVLGDRTQGVTILSAVRALVEACEGGGE